MCLQLLHLHIRISFGLWLWIWLHLLGFCLPLCFWLRLSFCLPLCFWLRLSFCLPLNLWFGLSLGLPLRTGHLLSWQLTTLLGLRTLGSPYVSLALSALCSTLCRCDGPLRVLCRIQSSLERKLASNRGRSRPHRDHTCMNSVSSCSLLCIRIKIPYTLTAWATPRLL